VSTISVIEDAGKLKQELVRLIEAAVAVHQKTITNRVGMIISFGRSAETFVEANASITTVLPQRFNLPLTNEQDFLLQVNRPRPSTVSSDIQINLISKWAVERVQLLTFTNLSTPVGHEQIASTAPIVKTLTVPTLVFDDSSVPA